MGLSSKPSPIFEAAHPFSQYLAPLTKYIEKKAEKIKNASFSPFGAGYPYNAAVPVKSQSVEAGMVRSVQKVSGNRAHREGCNSRGRPRVRDFD